MSTSTRNRLALTALWLLVYATFTLFLPALLDDADSVHAEVAREMLLRHDWITLYANGIRYLEKAPILYWSMALSFKLFGVSTAAARLPIALTVLTLALLLEAFARRAFASARAGLYAGLIFLSCFGIFIFTRITIPDIQVCLWLTLALYAFWLTEQPAPNLTGGPSLAAPSLRVRSFPCLLFAAACALNVLTKGLIGIVFPVGIVFLYLLLTRGFRGTASRLRQLHPLGGILTFLVIAAPWHILIGLANPTQGHPAPITFTNRHWQIPLPTDGNVHGWFWFYFVNEHLLRYLNLRVPRDYDTVPLALFWGFLLIWLMPWSAYLYPALKRVPLLRAVRKSPRHTPTHETRHSMADATRHQQSESGAPSLAAGSLSVGSPTAGSTLLGKTYLLFGLWALIPMLFFSLSTRQEYYVLPALPALILLLAAWLAAPSFQTARRISGTLALLGSIASAACVSSSSSTPAPQPRTPISPPCCNKIPATTPSPSATSSTSMPRHSECSASLCFSPPQPSASASPLPGFSTAEPNPTPLPSPPPSPPSSFSSLPTSACKPSPPSCPRKPFPTLLPRN